MNDQLLQNDESRREAQHAAIKAQVVNEVNAEIANQSEVQSPEVQPEIRRVAEEFRGKAVNEVVQAEREVERARGVARLSQFLDYGFFLIYGLLSLRFLLSLMAARSSAGFVQFIGTVTDIFYGPFRSIVPSPSIEGGFTLAMPVLVAILVYALAHAMINGFLRLLAHRKTTL